MVAQGSNLVEDESASGRKIIVDLRKVPLNVHRVDRHNLLLREDQLKREDSGLNSKLPEKTHCKLQQL